MEFNYFVDCFRDIGCEKGWFFVVMFGIVVSKGGNFSHK